MQEATFLTNQGAALFNSKAYGEALKRCRRAIQRDPSYEPAVAGAFQALLKLGPSRMNDAISFLRDDLAAQGQTALAAQYAWSLLEIRDWTAHPRAIQLLEVVLDHYTRIAVSHEVFERLYRQAVEEFRRQAEEVGSKELAAALQKISKAFSEAFAPPTTNQEARMIFETWGAGARKATIFSRFLKNAADFDQAKEQYERALARYSAAWLLDRGNTQAALHTAAILRRDPQRYDPDGRLLQSLSHTYDSLAGTKYAPWNWFKKQRFELSGEDYENLLRMRIHLSSLTLESNSVPAAACQLKKVEQVSVKQAELARRNNLPTPDLSPSILRRRGDLSGKQGDVASAYEYYLEAAEGYTKRCQIRYAQAALDQAHKAVVMKTTVPKEGLRLVGDLVSKAEADCKTRKTRNSEGQSP